MTGTEALHRLNAALAMLEDVEGEEVFPASIQRKLERARRSVNAVSASIETFLSEQGLHRCGADCRGPECYPCVAPKAGAR